MWKNMHKGDSFEYMSFKELTDKFKEELGEFWEAYDEWYYLEPSSHPDFVKRVIEEVADNIVCLKMLMFNLLKVYENLRKYNLP
jgi:hypothetical protein